MKGINQDIQKYVRIQSVVFQFLIIFISYSVIYQNFETFYGDYQVKFDYF